MAYDEKTTISDFLNAAAAKQPTPGGGSVAALVGALAASMGEMVLNYSVGKKSLAEHKPKLAETLVRFTKARAILLELMVADQTVFQTMTDLKKLPKDSTERRERLPAVAKESVNIPAAVAATGVAILVMSESLVPIVNHYLLSDLAVCADLAMATVRCASYNMVVNMPELPTEEDRHHAQADLQKMLAHATASVKRVAPAIWERHLSLQK